MVLFVMARPLSASTFTKERAAGVTIRGPTPLFLGRCNA